MFGVNEKNMYECLRMVKGNENEFKLILREKNIYEIGRMIKGSENEL